MPLTPELEDILHPEAEPYIDGMLKVSELHEIYYQAYGNKEGIPVICLHGGPGSGLSTWHARLFDLKKHHVILFDQRGCGQSKPFAEIKENTTPHLIEDMEKLRHHFNISDWYVFGGSWGSTLALAYADKHHEQVKGLILYGIFLARKKEYESMFTATGAAAQLYPEYYEKFLEALPLEDRSQPIKGYMKLFDGQNPKTREDALRSWSHWEMRLLDLVPFDEMFLPENEDMDFLTTHSLFERHYFESLGFIDGDQILNHIGGKLKDKPVSIVQGRYDLVCPPRTAYELHKAVPHSTLTMIPEAGHTAKNIGTMTALKEICDHLNQ